jgi:hypothetical protein
MKELIVGLFVCSYTCRYISGFACVCLCCWVEEHSKIFVIVVAQTKRQVVLLSYTFVNLNHTYYCGITDRY